MSVIVYGIKNCNTMKKALGWLDAHAVAYAFHDYKKAGVDRNRLVDWVKRAGGWEHLVNRSGLTYRGLPETVKETLDEASAIELMIGKPSIIRRPVIEAEGGRLLIGFSEDAFSASFEK